MDSTFAETITVYCVDSKQQKDTQNMHTLVSNDAARAAHTYFILQFDIVRNMNRSSKGSNDSPISDGATNRDNKPRASSQRLPFDNYPLPQRQNKLCSFVANQKTYLRLKGFQINELYTIRRNNIEKNVRKLQMKSHDNMSGVKKVSGRSTIELPPIFLTDRPQRQKKLQWQSIQEEVWKPGASRSFPRISRDLYAFRKEPDRALGVPRRTYIQSLEVKNFHHDTLFTQGKLRQWNSNTKCNLYVLKPVTV